MSDATANAHLARRKGAGSNCRDQATGWISHSVGLGHLNVLEVALGEKAEWRYLPMQPGDVAATFADTSRLTAWTGYEPGTAIRVGIAKFVEWYLRQYVERA